MGQEKFIISILLALLVLSNDSLHIAPGVIASKTDGEVKLGDDSGSQGGCAGCTVAVTLIQQYALANNMAYQQAMDGICDLVFQSYGVVRFVCTRFMETYGKNFSTLLNKGQDPDEVCINTNFCAFPQCRLHSEGSSVPVDKVSKPYWSIKEDFWEWLMNALGVDALVKDHKPYQDGDSDLFSSTMPQLRGSHWRGADCSDKSAAQHPGVIDQDARNDMNCNGIKGKRADGALYEDLYCPKDTLQVISVGDSMTAHFSFPPQYMNGRWYTNDTFKNLFSLLTDEFDLPYHSWWTGHLESTKSDEIFFGTNYFERMPGTTYHRQVNDESEWHHTRDLPSGTIKTDSLYLRYLHRNRCAHRQFQNIGHNGQRIIDDGLMETMSIDPKNSMPAFVIMSHMGNDHCKTEMTPTDVWKNALLAKLTKLSTMLPKGSHVLVSGVFDYDMHWPMLHNRTHPLGVSYARVFNYLNCLSISPCPMLMNPDPAVRQRGVAQGHAYNDAVRELLVSHGNAFSFDWDFTIFPLAEVLDIYKSLGGSDEANLFTPSCGFHMNTFGMSLMGPLIFNKMMAAHPDWFGPINPHNDEITKMFGDQGGWGN